MAKEIYQALSPTATVMVEAYEEQFRSGLLEFIEGVEGGSIIPEHRQDTFDVFEEEGNILLPTLEDDSLYLLPNWEIHELPIDALRRLPRYLSDTILLPQKTAAPIDHYLYWAWTASVSSSMRYRGRYLEFEEWSILRTFHNLIHLALQPNQVPRLSEETHNHLSDVAPSVIGVQYSGLNFASSIGFSLLEGLLYLYYEDRIEEEPAMKSESLQGNWRPPDSQDAIQGKTHRGLLEQWDESGPPTYHDKLQIWRSIASPTVNQTLSEMNDLSRYDVDILHRKLRGEAVSERLNQEAQSTENFLRVLYEQRNTNLHGKDSTQVIGPIILNLCCLVIWDRIPNEHFERLQKGTLVMIETTINPPSDSLDMEIPRGSNPYTPSAFYPL